jgi:tricorn protease
MSDVRFLAFDKSGKYLYFTASTDIGPTTNGIDMSGMQRAVTRSVYLVVLSKELPSPLAPESDEEKIKDSANDRPGEPDRPARDKPAAGGGSAPADSDTPSLPTPNRRGQGPIGKGKIAGSQR